MSSALRGLAKELADALNHELARQETVPTVRAESAELFDLLVSVLADRVALELQSLQNGYGSANPEALLNLAKSIRNQRQSSEGRHPDEQAGDPASAEGRSDIREKSPKYANIESLLRYDDGRDLAPGVKLVIMNFND